MDTSLSGLLLINGRDVWTEFSAFLAEESPSGHENYNALLKPAKTKAHVSVGLREENGERLAADLLPRAEGRDIDLRFALLADTPQQYLARFRAFIAFLKAGDKGWLTLRLPTLDLTLRCYYKDCAQLTQLTPIEGGSCQGAVLRILFREPVSSF